MTFSEIILISLGVSIDAAAVSVSGSLCPGKYSKWRCAFNAALFFGGIQFLMPVAGFYAAGTVIFFTEKVNHFIAFILLAAVGGKMVFEALFKKDSKSCPLGEFFSAKNMIIPAVATSMDAFVIGAGMAFSGNDIILPSSAMGVVTAAISFLCVIAGKKIADSASKSADRLTVAAGMIIFMIGLKILLQAFGVL